MILTQDRKLSVGRDLKRSLKSQVFKVEALDETAQRKLAGELAYVQAIEPWFINRLYVRYGPEKVDLARTGVSMRVVKRASRRDPETLDPWTRPDDRS